MSHSLLASRARDKPPTVTDLDLLNRPDFMCMTLGSTRRQSLFQHCSSLDKSNRRGISLSSLRTFGFIDNGGGTKVPSQPRVFSASSFWPSFRWQANAAACTAGPFFRKGVLISWRLLGHPFRVCSQRKRFCGVAYAWLVLQ